MSPSITEARPAISAKAGHAGKTGKPAKPARRTNCFKKILLINKKNQLKLFTIKAFERDGTSITHHFAYHALIDLTNPYWKLESRKMKIKFRKDLIGIGGYLELFIFLFVFSIIFTAFELYLDIAKDVKAAIPDFRIAADFLKLPAELHFVLGGYVILIAIVMYILYRLIYKKNWLTIQIVICFLALNSLAAPLMAFENQQYVSAGATIAINVIWIFYFLRSVRIANTYRKIQTEIAQRSFIPSQVDQAKFGSKPTAEDDPDVSSSVISDQVFDNGIQIHSKKPDTKQAEARGFLTDREIWQLVGAEIQNKAFDTALWTKVWTENDGSEEKAILAYSKVRFSELKNMQKNTKF